MKKNLPFNGKLADSENTPRVSLIIPFCPEMTKPAELAKLLASETEKAEQTLMKKYTEEEAVPVIKKLRLLTKKVKCSKDEKTLAIFVSPFAEKIYYFTPSQRVTNIPVLVKNDKY